MCSNRFFHPRLSCTTMHISADVQRITLNASCMTISGRRTKQLDLIAGFLPRHWLYEWFSQFHRCGTYSVLSRSPSIAIFLLRFRWLGLIFRYIILFSCLLMSFMVTELDISRVRLFALVLSWAIALVLFGWVVTEKLLFQCKPDSVYSIHTILSGSGNCMRPDLKNRAWLYYIITYYNN